MAAGTLPGAQLGVTASRRIGGCNRLTGSYELNGDRLTFRQVAITMMACLKGMTTENAFMKTLAEVKTWKIVGEELELFDRDGHLAARLEAVGTK
ncbi:MAG: META domain-containing protein [Deltaproteobacteria bacterium]|nr:META domain-containing protein [Deltaproteobacteria bacterium]